VNAVVRNFEGVVLDYGDSGALRSHHRAQKPQPSDRERSIVIAAEGELLTLRTIIDYVDFSEVALERIYLALNTVQSGLEMIRGRLGLQQPQKL